jgi:hypothetical protein
MLCKAFRAILHYFTRISARPLLQADGCGNYDIPEALDTELLLEHLDLLRSGKPAPLPIYDRITSQPSAFVDWVEPKPYIIIEFRPSARTSYGVCIPVFFAQKVKSIIVIDFQTYQT